MTDYVLPSRLYHTLRGRSSETSYSVTAPNQASRFCAWEIIMLVKGITLPTPSLVSSSL